ncbi:hypothetical protein SSP531S_59340 [Streptomyces spongiicola]|uniref:Uncharacterized protein n=1 Tax=Streptomyces spongiicola TaxID=1690221 RepID=A0A388T658_9ACTN|nr:hypothetical protein [Streptomyces spongiicola]GBQ04438.1 hypothetical protein SSP531S_59340 [Streptomyces spongiicola]
MLTTAAQPRPRMAALAVRARNIVGSGLCVRTSAVPDWLARLDQLEHLTAAAAADRRESSRIDSFSIRASRRIAAKSSTLVLGPSIRAP